MRPQTLAKPCGRISVEVGRSYKDPLPLVAVGVAQRGPLSHHTQTRPTVIQIPIHASNPFRLFRHDLYLPEPHLSLPYPFPTPYQHKFRTHRALSPSVLMSERLSTATTTFAKRAGLGVPCCQNGTGARTPGTRGTAARRSAFCSWSHPTRTSSALLSHSS